MEGVEADTCGLHERENSSLRKNLVSLISDAVTSYSQSVPSKPQAPPRSFFGDDLSTYPEAGTW